MPIKSKIENRKSQVRAGTTLLEIILSVAVATILVAATVSMMFIARQAVASNAAASDRLAQQSRIMQMIALDVNLATSFTERTDKAITMVVPDRTGDGQPETIRYVWSGTAGGTLTRQINGGAVVAIASDIYQFKLTYIVKTLQTTALPPDAGAPQYALVGNGGAAW